MKIFSFIGRKGGITKTTQCVNVAAACAQAGLRTLIVDGDAQASACEVLGVAASNGLYNLLERDADWQDILQPAPVQFAGEDAHLFVLSNGEYGRLLESEKHIPAVMVDRFAELEGFFDIVCIDTSPGTNNVNVGAFYASDYAVLPTTLEYESILSLEKTLSYLDSARESGDKAGYKSADVLCISPAKFRPRESVQRTNLGFIDGRYGHTIKVLTKPIRELTAWRQSAQGGYSINTYWPSDDYSIRGYIRSARKDLNPLVELVMNRTQGVPA